MSYKTKIASSKLFYTPLYYSNKSNGSSCMYCTIKEKEEKKKKLQMNLGIQGQGIHIYVANLFQWISFRYSWHYSPSCWVRWWWIFGWRFSWWWRYTFHLDSNRSPATLFLCKKSNKKRIYTIVRRYACLNKVFSLSRAHTLIYANCIDIYTGQESNSLVRRTALLGSATSFADERNKNRSK